MALKDRTLSNYKSWEDARAEVKSGGTHWYRTSALAPINSALKTLLGTADVAVPMTMAKRRAVEDAIHSVTEVSRAEQKYKDLLRWLITQLRTLCPYDESTLKNKSAHPHISVDKAAQLNVMIDFACSDVKSWPGNIKKGEKGRVMNRYYLTREDSAVGESEAAANNYGKCIGKYKHSALELTAKNILAARSACCTTFALTAASILAGKTRDPKATRVELVAVPGTHCFVVVGREGGLDGQHLPSADSWGANSVVVDPWLGSLGHEVIYPSIDQYPYQEWLRDLEQNYDSHAEERVVFNLQAGLRSRPGGVKVT